jgi:hypothetical protein
MGDIYKLSCTCGYAKELNVGGGLASCNVNMINKVFSEDRRAKFDTYLKNNEIQSFLIENEISVCEECKEVMTIAVLRIQLTNNRKLEIVNDCPLCGNKAHIINYLAVCPKCGRKINVKEIGHWD